MQLDATTCLIMNCTGRPSDAEIVGVWRDALNPCGVVSFRPLVRLGELDGCARHDCDTVLQTSCVSFRVSELADCSDRSGLGGIRGGRLFPRQARLAEIVAELRR